MAKRPVWHDEYWLLLISLYLKQPMGVKHLYSKDLVDVALELHIHPRYIHRKMYELRRIDTPRLQHLWDEYANNPKKLARGIKLLRRMNGFGKADAFYAGVEVNNEEWETYFLPIDVAGNKDKPARSALTPAKLLMILDLYFRLTPITMVPETPEVAALAKLIHNTPKEVADILEVFRVCDPYLTHDDFVISPLLQPCMEVWKRFGNEDPEKIAELAAQLKAYWTD